MDIVDQFASRVNIIKDRKSVDLIYNHRSTERWNLYRITTNYHYVYSNPMDEENILLLEAFLGKEETLEPKSSYPLLPPEITLLKISPAITGMSVSSNRRYPARKIRC